MSRPIKRRRICRMPSGMEFGPFGRSECVDTIILTVDEYEVLRLVDLEGLTQEECSVQMEVSRPSICMMLEHARRKMADMLVHGKKLRIEGGSVVLCESAEGCCGKCGRDCSTCSVSACTCPCRKNREKAGR